MILGRVAPVFHHHLKKCGGTSLNHWLDSQTDDARCWNEAWLDQRCGYPGGELTAPERADLAARLRRQGIAAFRWADIIHTHAPLAHYAPPGTFRFTMLRDPVARLVSQVADWRRLTDHDLAGLDPGMRDCLVDARQMRLAPFLSVHARAEGRLLLDNYMTRAIAATRLGPVAEHIIEAADLLDPARIALAQDYDLVGVSEQAGRTRRALARRLGWAPAPDVPRLNATGSAHILRGEALEAADQLAALTAQDQVLYAQACARFAADDLPYDLDAFDAAASARVAQLRGAWRDGATVFSVRGPLIGHGWHGRDATGTPDCAVWTGPERLATLYIPVPPGQALTLRLWVRGYADEAQRAALRFHADGHWVPHRFAHEDPYRDVLELDVVAARDFVRLQIDAGDPVATQAPDHDARRRAVSFDRYGWVVR